MKTTTVQYHVKGRGREVPFVIQPGPELEHFEIAARILEQAAAGIRADAVRLIGEAEVRAEIERMDAAH